MKTFTTLSCAVALAGFLAASLQAADAKLNELSAPEKKEGWKLLFDGKQITGWRSFKKGEIDFFIKNEKGGSVCVNPVSWTTSTDETKPRQHKGAIWKDMNKLIPGVISASIEPEHKILWVDAPEKEQEKIGGKVKNYHVADYNLFWLDIRENAMLRVKAFLEK